MINQTKMNQLAVDALVNDGVSLADAMSFCSTRGLSPLFEQAFRNGPSKNPADSLNAFKKAVIALYRS